MLGGGWVPVLVQGCPPTMQQQIWRGGISEGSRFWGGAGTSQGKDNPVQEQFGGGGGVRKGSQCRDAPHA